MSAYTPPPLLPLPSPPRRPPRPPLATMCVQCGAPDLNRDHVSLVWRAGPTAMMCVAMMCVQ